MAHRLQPGMLRHLRHLPSRQPISPRSAQLHPQQCHSSMRPALSTHHLLTTIPPARRQSTVSTASPTPSLSAGTDLATIQPALAHLTRAPGKWTLRANGAALERTFKFKTFKQAWAFMSAVAQDAAAARHHPEWSNVYNRVLVRWTTHNPAGLSTQDLRLAARCDELAARKESLALDEDGESCVLESRVDALAATAVDCCGVKS